MARGPPRRSARNRERRAPRCRQAHEAAPGRPYLERQGRRLWPSQSQTGWPRLRLDGAEILLNDRDRVADRRDRLQAFLRHLDLEGVLDIHHDLEGRKRIEPEI